jgi:hypothetical protein
LQAFAGFGPALLRCSVASRRAVSAPTLEPTTALGRLSQWWDGGSYGAENDDLSPRRPGLEPGPIRRAL